MITLAIVIVVAIIVAAALSCIPTERVSNTLETPPMSDRERRYHSDNSVGR